MQHDNCEAHKANLEGAIHMSEVESTTRECVYQIQHLLMISNTRRVTPLLENMALSHTINVFLS